MHSNGSRWEFRECAVAYFGFCACVPLVRIVRMEVVGGFKGIKAVTRSLSAREKLCEPFSCFSFLYGYPGHYKQTGA